MCYAHVCVVVLDVVWFAIDVTYACLTVIIVHGVRLMISSRELCRFPILI